MHPPPLPDEPQRDAAVTAIRSARRIALVGHVTPDADCVGAMGALWLALPELGKHPYLALPRQSVSRRLRIVMDAAGLSPAAPAELAECDLAIVLDTAREKRVHLEGKLEALPRATIINIDHHATNTRFGRVNWVRESASSTSELAWELLAALGCHVTPTVATLLYAGLHSDTQGFSLSNTTARCLEVAHALAIAGARIREVCEQLHRSHSRGEFELLQTVYRNTRVTADGLLAWSTISFEEISAAGADASAIDDQVEIPRSVEGIAVAILFSEGEPGVVRINFRGERGVSVLELAEQFGGGGHRSSAGARVRGALPEVAERVLGAAQRFAAVHAQLDVGT